MSRNADLILLCEDQQHSAFITRFLVEMGWNKRRIRVIPGPQGKGSAEKHVRENFPKELREYRGRRNRVHCNLAVMIDGDNLGVEGRIQQFDDECKNQGVEPRTSDDKVAIFVPTWRIETWFAYLDGHKVDEGCRSYPRLSRPRDCKRHVEKLSKMCQRRKFHPPPPSSLIQSRQEFGRLQGS